MKERRRHQRVPVSLKLLRERAIAVEETQSIGFGYAKDISESGMAVDGQALEFHGGAPQIGERVDLRFKLPGGTLFLGVRGSILRVESLPDRGYQIAMKFEDLDPRFEEEIQRFVAESRR